MTHDDLEELVQAQGERIAELEARLGQSTAKTCSKCGEPGVTSYEDGCSFCCADEQSPQIPVTVEARLLRLEEKIAALAARNERGHLIDEAGEDWGTWPGESAPVGPPVPTCSKCGQEHPAIVPCDAFPAPTACDSWCVGTCGSGRKVDHRNGQHAGCFAWRCNGSGPAHRRAAVDKPAEAPAVRKETATAVGEATPTAGCQPSTKRGKGWIQVVPFDKSGRRSLWVRQSVGRLELCSGREGDDAGAFIPLDGSMLSRREVSDLKQVAEYAIWAFDIDDTEEEEESCSCVAYKLAADAGEWEKCVCGHEAGEHRVNGGCAAKKASDAD
jgi:hypothetical protein